jgi:hypothetical protein
VSEGSGHSSYLAWLTYEFRAIARILPNLKTRPKHAWLAPFALCLLVLLATLGIGVYVDGYVIHPPAQYTGICPTPAVVRGGNCVQIIITQVTVSGTLTYQTQTIPAGHIILPNATKEK